MHELFCMSSEKEFWKSVMLLEGWFKGNLKTCLEADAIVLGSPIFPAYELVKYPYILRENLPIPEDEDMVMGIALGYESDEHINTFESPRLDLDEILKIN